MPDEPCTHQMPVGAGRILKGPIVLHLAIRGQSWGVARPPAACPAARPLAAAAGWVGPLEHRLPGGLLLNPRSCRQAVAHLDIQHTNLARIATDTPELRPGAVYDDRQCGAAIPGRRAHAACQLSPGARLRW